MTRLIIAALLAAAPTAAVAAEPQKPEPGTSWVKVTYTVGKDGDGGGGRGGEQRGDDQTGHAQSSQKTMRS